MPDSRPDPAELLARVQREELRAGIAEGGSPRGRLKIFFGMAPGVGKTYAMLAAAQRIAAGGVDVVVGVAETHGRSETEQLLLGLDVLARKQVEYRGTDHHSPAVTLAEFDVDAAIARRPDILLVDELAHTNAPGSAREKRWQDVQACLKAGLNVYTTLNVQHIESLNDVVAQITGVAVRETVPDWVIDEADEIELVDVPVEVLHDRLKAGKVYLAENAARAVDPSDGYFRKGNLTALRELALRRTAAWVDSEMRRYKQDRGIRAVWPAGERILVAVSPSPMSAKLVRAAKRMAAGLHADLLAVYVETPRSTNLTQADRDRLMQTLRLAESLGASTTTLSADNAARELIAFARSRNVSRIVVGKTGQPRWREAIFGNFVNNLIRESGDIDISVVRGDEAQVRADEGAGPATSSATSFDWQARAKKLLLALAVVGIVTLLGWIMFGGLELANIAMVYLAAVVVSALWLGRGAAVLSAIAGVAAFDYFFVPPKLTFAVTDVQYVLTFGTMLAVGLIIGTLAARTREQARTARERERRTAALFAMSRELAAAQDAREVASVSARHVHDALACDVVVAVPTRASNATAEPSPHGLPVLDPIGSAGSPDWFDDRERSIAQWALDHGRPAGLGTQKLPSAAARHVPLIGTSGKLGLVALRPHSLSHMLDTSSLLLLDTFASQLASALERVSLIESQHAARLETERERLRSALLSSVSHDLRTPLSSITGAASALQQAGAELPPETRTALLSSIVDESARLSDLIANLVFATRLEAGGVALRTEWTTVEEVVGVGLSRHRDVLASRPFRVLIPDSLPMIRVDSAMLPQVIYNLIENAVRYTPAGTPISVTAWSTDTQVIVKVADDGPGLAEEDTARVFQRFYRGRTVKAGESSSQRSSIGMGLGLTISEGIIKAHGGRIWAEPNSPRGVAFMFSLPIELPQPPMPGESAAVSVEGTVPQGGVA